jgi:hypothetical protein
MASFLAQASAAVNETPHEETFRHHARVRRATSGVEAPFQKTLAYKGEAAEKAVKTRAANKAAKIAATTATPATATTTH